MSMKCYLPMSMKCYLPLSDATRMQGTPCSSEPLPIQEGASYGRQGVGRATRLIGSFTST